MHTVTLNDVEAKSLREFIEQHPDEPITLITNYGSGIGINVHAFQTIKYWELVEKFGDEITYEEYNKVGRDITDYESW